MTLWGGRFSEEPDDALWRFTVDRSDSRLLVDDISGSLAHVGMLGEVGVLGEGEVDAIRNGLQQILAEAASGSFEFLESDEDVHTAVERRLGELVGEVAGKLHTGRSRNDQVALDLRLYSARAAGARIEDLGRFIRALVDKAEAVGEVIVPAFTHLQPAQALPLAHHLLAYAWMLVRDRERFLSASHRIAVSPLGAGAGGGSSLPLDPASSAATIGLHRVFDNSMDAVASRDFVAEYVFCCAQAMIHLSRLAEEMILWSTTEFGWVTYADRHTTGSSALPHKRNPDVAELVRGRSATVIGDLTALLAMQKALPLAYNRDLQEDKRALFHADDTLAGSLEALGAMFDGAEFHPPEPSGWVGALDLAEGLTGAGIPFREAHDLVGRVVALLARDGRTLADATLEDFSAVDERLLEHDLAVPSAAASVAARRSPGGGSMDSVRQQIRDLRRYLVEDQTTGSPSRWM